MKVNRQTKRLVSALAVFAIVWAAQEAGIDLGTFTSSEVSAPNVASSDADERFAPSAANDRIEEALARRESGFMVTLDARVVKTLPDDDEGSRHQRFLIELDSGRSILVAHNIDLARRVPIRRGDNVRVRGQFEWNEKGGVLHWTHHDPDGRHPGGWIEHAGARVE